MLPLHMHGLTPSCGVIGYLIGIKLLIFSVRKLSIVSFMGCLYICPTVNDRTGVSTNLSMRL